MKQYAGENDLRNAIDGHGEVWFSVQEANGGMAARCGSAGMMACVPHGLTRDGSHGSRGSHPRWMGITLLTPAEC